MTTQEVDTLPRLSECETIIERGLSTFVEVGNALLEIRDSRLYRESHATFEDYCKERWGMDRRRANKFIQAADVVIGLMQAGPHVAQLPSNERQAVELAAIEPPLRASVWERALETAPEGKVTAAHVREVAREFVRTETPAPVYRHVSDDSYEWYTPTEYIEAARRVMGGIDLDPASCASANEVVCASAFYSLEDDGLTREWRGRVYLNPPYSYPAVEQFCQRLVEEYNAGKVKQAIVLVNNSTDSAWFHDLARACGAFCLTRGRVRYWGPNSAQARQGQAFFYLGPARAAFMREFSAFGIVVEVANVN